MRWRNSAKGTNFISTPSIIICPAYNSNSLDKVYAIVDLPAPVLPTIPTFIPGSTSNETFSKTNSVVGLYFKLISLYSILPFYGQDFS